MIPNSRCAVAQVGEGAVSTAIQLKSAWWLAVFGATTFGNPASAQGLLNAPCAVSNSSALQIKDYKTYPSTTNGRGHDMAAFVRGKNARRRYRLHDAGLVDGQRQGRGRHQLLELGPADDLERSDAQASLVAPPLREAHSTPVTNMFATDWRTWVLQTTTGFSVYNLDSVAAPVLATELHDQRRRARVAPALPAICAGELRRLVRRRGLRLRQRRGLVPGTGGALSLRRQAANGLNIYKFTDPADRGRDRVDQALRHELVRSPGQSDLGARQSRRSLPPCRRTTASRSLDLSDPANLVKLGQLRPGHDAADSQRLCLDLNGNALYAATKPDRLDPCPGLADLRPRPDNAQAHDQARRWPVDARPAAMSRSRTTSCISACHLLSEDRALTHGTGPRASRRPAALLGDRDPRRRQRLPDAVRQRGLHRQRSSHHARQHGPVPRRPPGHERSRRERP